MVENFINNLIDPSVESGEQNTSTDIKSGDNYKSWHVKKLLPEEFELLSPEARLQYLIVCAHLAPSTHNTQPWAFQCSPEEQIIKIYLDRGEYLEDGTDSRRVLPASDVVGRQACISLGCAVANLTTAARYFGLEPDLQIEPINSESIKPLIYPNKNAQRYVPLIKAHFPSPTSTNTSREVFEAIFSRKMNRSKYNTQLSIPDQLVQTMESYSTDNNVGLHLLNRARTVDGLRLRAIAELQAQADSFVASNAKFTEELGHWFLPNNGDSYLGMPGDTFGLADEQSIRFHKGLLGQIPLQAEEKAGFAKSSKDGIESSSYVGLITVPQDIPEYWIKAGITLEQIALLLEVNRIGFAVHAGLAEVKFVRSFLSGIVKSKNPLVILFRFGYPREARTHSPRLPLNEVLLKKSTTL